MEADAAYQGCLPFCELQSRSLAVECTGTCDLEIAVMSSVAYKCPGHLGTILDIRHPRTVLGHPSKLG